MLGIILLVGSLLMIGSILARFGTSTVANARNRDGDPSPARHQAVLEVSNSVARTVKYIVVPAGLLLLGGVLMRSGRRDERVHELNVQTEAEN
jgi:membrane-associated PAP2 superfamily phosphatase